MSVPQHLADTIVDPQAYAAEKPVDEAFAWLRANAPFEQVEPAGFPPIWAATRYQDIKDIEVRPDLFCSGANLPTLASLEALRLREESGFTGSRTLVSMDPPEHGPFRRLTQNWFMPVNLKRLEGQIRARVRKAVDRMAELGDHCDFARQIAMYYPLQVIMMILGIPPEDEEMVLDLTLRFFGSRDPEFSDSNEAGEIDTAQAQANLQKTMAQLTEYFTKLTLDRRANPTEDLASAIANGVVDGQLISMEAAIGYYIITATAGHDTTANTASIAMWTLAERPELLQRLRAEPEMIRPFLDEVLRWGTPVKHFVRTATCDLEFAGQQVRKGDRVMLCYASGNRDESVFDRPFEFDIDRKPNRHIAFGYGPHVCVGQPLAALELRLLLEELLPRLESVSLSGEPRRVEANFVCGPKSLPIRYKLKPAE